jgi:hypothetical protein
MIINLSDHGGEAIRLDLMAAMREHWGEAQRAEQDRREHGK